MYFRVVRLIGVCWLTLWNYCVSVVVFFLMIRRPPRSTQSRSSAASDVYKRQGQGDVRLSDRLLEWIEVDGNKVDVVGADSIEVDACLLYTSPSPRDS